MLLIVYYYFGWRNLLILLLCDFCHRALLLYQLSVDDTVKKKVSLKDVFYFFASREGTRIFMVLVLLFRHHWNIGHAQATYMVDLGYNAKEIGFMAGIFGTAVAAGCAFAAGWVLKKLGRHIPMYFVLGLSFYRGGLFFGCLLPKQRLLFALYAGIAHVVGCLWVFHSSHLYHFDGQVQCPGRRAQLPLQIVITHLSGLIIAVLSGKLGDMLGYQGLFGIELC